MPSNKLKSLVERLADDSKIDPNASNVIFF